MVRLTGSGGTVRAFKVDAVGSNTTECSATTIGVMLVDGKWMPAALQNHRNYSPHPGHHLDGSFG